MAERATLSLRRDVAGSSPPRARRVEGPSERELEAIEQATRMPRPVEELEERWTTCRARGLLERARGDGDRVELADHEPPGYARPRPSRRPSRARGGRRG